MSDQQRNVWAQLSQGDSFQKQQQQYPVPDGYAPVHGYAPVQGYAPSEAQNGSSNYQESSAGYYGTHQTQSDNTHTVDGDDDNDDEDTSEEDIREFMSSRRQQRKSKSQAVPKKDQPKSKRAELREKIANENHGEVSATDQPKGLVEWREGIFQWWDPTNSEVRHFSQLLLLPFSSPFLTFSPIYSPNRKFVYKERVLTPKRASG